MVPVGKFPQRLPVIPLGVNRRAAIRGQVREEFLNPLVSGHGFGRCSVSHMESIQYFTGICSKMETSTNDFVSMGFRSPK
jgi:hypothetical protein